MTESEIFTLTLVFDERESGKIHEIADAVSDPDAPQYGRYLDRNTLRELVLLTDEERQTIADWLTEQGLKVLTVPEASGQLMFLQATEDQVLTVFGRDLKTWLDKDPDNRGARRKLAMPRRLAGYVQKVGGLPGEQGQSSESISGFSGLEVHDSTPGVDTAEPPPDTLAGVTPEDVRRIYSFPEEWDGSGETIALMMLGGAMELDDLEGFWRAHGVTPPEVRRVYVGRQSERKPHFIHTLEATMSVEWLGALAPGARIIVYFLDPTVMADPWAGFFFALAADDENAPTVASTSWVTPERHYYRLHGSGVVTGLLNQLTALGVTVISASGDWGTFDGIPRAIQNGRPVTDAPWPHGIFPAVEERVLSVGGTMITHRAPLTEIGWSGPPPPGQRKAIHFELMASSGGFSDDVPIPPWQKPALRPYYPRGASTPAVVPYGRGFPDVAMVASGPAIQRLPGEPLSSLGFRALCGGQWVDFAGQHQRAHLGGYHRALEPGAARLRKKPPRLREPLALSPAQRGTAGFSPDHARLQRRGDERGQHARPRGHPPPARF